MLTLTEGICKEDEANDDVPIYRPAATSVGATSADAAQDEEDWI